MLSYSTKVLRRQTSLTQHHPQAALKSSGIYMRSLRGYAQQQQQQQPQPQPQRRYFNGKEHIRPYSDSLPSPGYEWCSRCQIRTHRFQKPQGKHNACLDTPRLFGVGVCGSARQYYQQQMTHMLFLSLFCFAAAPIYNRATMTHSQEHDEE